MLPTVLRKCEGKATIIFHCALSQQRGPSVALRYMREAGRARKQQGTAPAGLDGPSASSGGTSTGANSNKDTAGTPGTQGQKVYVLDRGFVGWQEAYGEDERLTDGYRKELWKDGYWG
jgi:rhodanese-related sulfurtransferase